jgi:trk system potassium uptake protein TrkH
MAEFLRKLTAVMFYASLPMLIPIAYSLFAGDGAWAPIGLTMLLLAFPAVPHILRAALEDLKNFVKSILTPDTPFNYSILVDIHEMRREVESLTLGQILTLTSVVWILVPTISTIPYVYYGVPLVDAFFESMSGWTSTGLSSLPTLSNLPSTMILFRSITQWIGGLGIVVLILAVVRGKEAMKFLKAEGRPMAEFGIGETVGIIFRTYAFLTIAGIILLIFLGMNLFEAVNLTFAGISNGGFFPFDNFDFTDIQKFALAMLMFAGATSFIFYRNIWEGNLKKSIFDEEFILYVIITIIAIVLIAYVGGEGFYNTVLNTISAIACGGFAIGDLGILHDFPLYLLILLMLSGGMVGSTTGGIKLWRILVIVKSIINQIRKAFLPSGTVQVVKINDSAISEHAIVESATFVFTYLAIFLFASGMFTIADYDLGHSLFMVASAMGNVGLSTVDVPAIGSLGKAFLILLMYLGRIEIFPSLALINYLIRR